VDSNLNYLIASRSNVTNRVVYLSSSSTSSSKVSHVLGEIWGEISRENLKSFENFFFFSFRRSIDRSISIDSKFEFEFARIFGQLARTQPGQRIYPPPQRAPHFGHARSGIIVAIVVVCIDRRGAAYGCNRNLEHRLRNIVNAVYRDRTRIDKG